MKFVQNRAFFVGNRRIIGLGKFFLSYPIYPISPAGTAGRLVNSVIIGTGAVIGRLVVRLARVTSKAQGTSAWASLLSVPTEEVPWFSDGISLIFVRATVPVPRSYSAAAR